MPDTLRASRRLTWRGSLGFHTSGCIRSCAGSASRRQVRRGCSPLTLVSVRKKVQSSCHGGWLPLSLSSPSSCCLSALSGDGPPIVLPRLSVPGILTRNSPSLAICTRCSSRHAPIVLKLVEGARPCAGKAETCGTAHVAAGSQRRHHHGVGARSGENNRDDCWGNRS